MRAFSNLITIAVPVYERYDFFEDCIKSALNQSVACQILVVDNCSSHNKFETYIEGLNSSAITYHRNDVNLGMVGNWNKCIQLVETEWITILHDDDLLYTDYIACFVCVAQKLVDVACIASQWKWAEQPDYESVFKQNKIGSIKVRKFSSIEFNYNILSPFPGIAFNKKNLDLQFKQNFYPISDFDFWYRISKLGSIVIFNKIQAYYRLDPAQTSSNVVEDIIKKAYLYRKQTTQNKGLLTYLFFLATTSNSVVAGNKRYSKNMSVFNFVDKEDFILMKLLSFKPNLYIIYMLKYLLYKYPKMLSFKSLDKFKTVTT